eukprot:gnl/MRDRNA2_/MRDRNA2_120783_c0_seq1.p1 gnl/MRDRNA2_/MRDRNA2_120783_c0~~gnl/MRDRNA2_/MRDRNA2_120783_c0_seq1.p1  ORF type:complete len:429 (-),score=59.92 gnl/MRDRNA2_/MRDRNA2_120783_c0_seq1:29-1315(-)
MSEFSMFADCALKEMDSDAASDSTASGCVMSDPQSLPTTPDRFAPPGLAAKHLVNLSLHEHLNGDASPSSESDVEAPAVDLSPVGAVGHFAAQYEQPGKIPPPAPPSGLDCGGVDIYSSPPPGLHRISAHAHVARPPPGLERGTEALPSNGIPAPPPELPPVSLFSQPIIPEVPVWAAAGVSELASEPCAFEPLPWDANISLMGNVTNGQPLNPGGEAMMPFTNPLPGWSSCVVSDHLNPEDVSLKIEKFSKHHVRENSPDRKRNLCVNGESRSHNVESCWQQVPQIPQLDIFNGLEQNDGCQLAGNGTMWNSCEGWQQDLNSTYNPNLYQPPNSNGISCFAHNLSSAYNSDAYNSDMHQELHFHHGLGQPQELYLADAIRHHRHHVDRQGSTEFMGDLIQSCGQSHPWNMQNSGRQNSAWTPAFFAP